MKNMRRNLPLLVIALMLLGNTLARSEERVRAFPVKRLGVFDSRGKMVGEVLDLLTPFNAVYSFDTQIALSVDGVLVTLIAQRENLLPGRTVTGPENYLFESTNCSGAPWVVFREFESSLVTPVTWIDNKLYVPDGDSVGQEVIVRSYLLGTNCFELLPQELFLTPSRLLIDLRALFPPPYTLLAADSGKH